MNAAHELAAINHIIKSFLTDKKFFIQTSVCVCVNRQKHLNRLLITDDSANIKR